MTLAAATLAPAAGAAKNGVIAATTPSTPTRIAGLGTPGKSWAPARSTAAPSGPRQGVPVIDATSIPVGTEIDATNGVLLTFQPTVPGAANAEATALLNGGTFKLVSRTERMPTLRLMESCATPSRRAAALVGVAASNQFHRYKRLKASVKADGDFRILTKHIIAAPQGTRYVVSASCAAERVTVDAGVVEVTTFMGPRAPERVVPGGVAVIHLVYGPTACAPAGRSAALRAIRGSGPLSQRAHRLSPQTLARLRSAQCGRFRTRGTQSSATVRG